MASTSGQQSGQPPPHEERFKSNMESLTKVLYGYFQNLYSRNITKIQPNTILIAQGVVEAYNPIAVLENYIEYSKDFWPKIAARDDSFMVENCHEIFRDIPTSNPDELIRTFKTLYTSRIILDKSTNNEIVVTPDDPRYNDGHNVLTDSEKDTIWRLFTAMTKISIKYIHDKREPIAKFKEVDGATKTVRRYKTNAFPDVKNIVKLAKMFEIELLWKSPSTSS